MQLGRDGIWSVTRSVVAGSLMSLWAVRPRSAPAPLHEPAAQEKQRPVSAQAACRAPAETAAQNSMQTTLQTATQGQAQTRPESDSRLREEERLEEGRCEIRWLPELTARHTVSDDGRTLTRLSAGRTPAGAWASGPLLPTAGASSWCIRIHKSLSGAMVLGVQDAAGRWAWGLNPGAGTLWRHSRDANGFIGTVMPPEGSGWPDRNGTHVLKDADGNPTNLCGKAEGAVIEVCVDHDGGSLSFRVDRGPLHPAVLSGFPPAASLRPWARLYHGVHDRVTLVPVPATRLGLEGRRELQDAARWETLSRDGKDDIPGEATWTGEFTTRRWGVAVDPTARSARAGRP